MYSLYNTTTKTWKAQLNDIKGANSSIYFEQYILEDFKDGEIGKQFIDALIDKAKSGLEVRLILDFQGSLDLFQNDELNQQLKDAGLLITYYKTLPASKAFSPIRLMLRNHRKFMLIDHTITWIGGVVVGEKYRDWSDLMVRFTDLTIADYCSREFRHQLQRLEGSKIILAPLDRINSDTQLVGNSPGIGNRFCYEKISHAIMLAKKSVTIVTPYFSPPLRMHRVIKRRLLEGAEVVLIVPKHSDNKIADWSREIYLVPLIKMGLIVYYLDFMNHAKIVMTDDNWCSFGSTNIDALSLIFNHELNLITTDGSLVADIKKVTKDWIRNLEPIKANDLLYSQMNRWERVVGRVSRYFA